MNILKLAIVSCGFLGCSPFAPGTVGTLGGVAIAYLLRGNPDYLMWSLVAAAVIYAISAPLGPWAERYAKKKDPGIFVMDEVIGYLITVAWVSGPSLLTLVTGFFVFRFFDILKPPPARQAEHIPGGHGILLDDVFAGLWGLAAMAVLRLTIEANWTFTGA